MRLALRALTAIFLCAAALARAGPSAAYQPPAASGPVGLTLSASPAIVDVGFNVNVVLSAKSWPGPMSATVSFVSPHHGFSGKMVWNAGCSCFRLSIWLAKRVHSLEVAKAVGTVLLNNHSFSARTTFQVRGLAPSGQSYAPGGKPSLTTWVTDPQPNPGEVEHYCAWVATADGLGVAGYAIHFAVHFPGSTKSWSAGNTGTSGIACVKKSIGSPAGGTPIKVDAYAGNLHATTSFTPR